MQIFGNCCLHFVFVTFCNYVYYLPLRPTHTQTPLQYTIILDIIQYI